MKLAKYEFSHEGRDYSVTTPHRRLVAGRIIQSWVVEGKRPRNIDLAGRSFQNRRLTLLQANGLRYAVKEEEVARAEVELIKL